MTQRPPQFATSANTSSRSRRHFLAHTGAGLAALLSGTAQAGFALTAPAAAAEVLQFAGIVDGVRTELQLRRRGERFDGELREQGMSLPLAGEVQGQQWRGQIELPGGLGLRLPFQAETRGAQLHVRLQLLPGSAPVTVTLQRSDGAAAATQPQAAAPRSGPGRIEPAMVGRWVHDNVITSPGGAGGFASFATRRIVMLGADGRAVMSSVAAGGGGSWSSTGGERVEFSGRWELRGDQLWVAADGGAFEAIARISMVGGRLVVYTGNGRQIWTR